MLYVELNWIVEYSPRCLGNIFFCGPATKALPLPPPSLVATFFRIFFEVHKKLPFFSGPAFTPPTSPFFCGFPNPGNLPILAQSKPTLKLSYIITTTAFSERKHMFERSKYFSFVFYRFFVLAPP